MKTTIICLLPTSLINGDLAGKGSNFQQTVSHLLVADPVEKRLTKSGTKRAFDAVVSGTQLAGRDAATGVDLRWYPTPEFKKLSNEKKAALAEWRKTPEGEAAFKAARAEQKAEQKSRKRSGGNGNNGSKYTKKQKQNYQNAIKKAAVSMVKKAAKELDQEQENAMTVTRETATQVASMLQVKAAENAAPSISVVPEVKAVQFADEPKDVRKARFSSLMGKIKLKGKGKKKSGN